MIYHVALGRRTFVVDLRSGVTVDGKPLSVDFARVEGGPVRSLLVDGASYALVARRLEAGVWDIHLRGRRIKAEVVDDRTRAVREAMGSVIKPHGPRPVVAPMPGLVVRVEVGEGDTVRTGQGLVIVEAMKMENELRAEGPCVVTRVHVGEGDAVEKDQLLVELAPVKEAAD